MVRVFKTTMYVSQSVQHLRHGHIHLINCIWVDHSKALDLHRADIINLAITVLMDRKDSDTPSWQRKFLDKYISVSYQASQLRSKLDNLPFQHTQPSTKKYPRPSMNREVMLSALYEDDEAESVRQWAAAVASHDPMEAESTRRESSSITIKPKPRGRASSIFTLRRGSSFQSVRSRLMSVTGRKMP